MNFTNNQTTQRLQTFALLLATAVTGHAETIYYSTVTGQYTSAPQPADHWRPPIAGHWQVNPYRPRMIIDVTQDGRNLLSLDGGATFTPLATPFSPTEPPHFIFDAADPLRLYAHTSSAFRESRDGGVHWASVTLPQDNETSPLVVSEANDGRVHLFIARGPRVWQGDYDAAGDVSWQVSLDAASAITALAVNHEQSTLIAGTLQGAVYVHHGSSPGSAWTSTAVRSAAITSVAFDPLDDRRVALGFSQPAQPGEASVYVSHDGGISFTPAADPSGGAVRQLLFVDDNQNRVRLYALTSAVYVTEDFSIWAQEAGLVHLRIDSLQAIAHGGSNGLIAQSRGSLHLADIPAGACASPASSQPVIEVPAAGGNVTLPVQPGSGCGPSVLSVDPNGSPEDRNLYATVAHQKVVIHQQGRNTAAATVAACEVMSVSGSHVGKSGGKVTITVRKTTACGIISLASSQPQWIDLSIPQIVTNSTASFTVTVWSNPGTARSGAINFYPTTGRVTGAPVAITQDAGSTCNGANAAISQAGFPQTGGSATLTLTPSGVCPGLTAKSNVSWIVLHSTGTNQFSVNVGATSGQRNGTITISDSTHSDLREVAISQDGPGGASPPPAPGASTCKGISAILTPNSLPAAGGSATLKVTPNGTCSYTVVPNVSWIAARLTSTNQYTMTLVANTGGARHGTLQVATSGNAFSTTVGVDQSGQIAPCSAVSASLNNNSFPSSGGTATLTVTPTGNCGTPVVTPGVSWITATTIGTNVYTLNIAANSSTQARPGTLKIGFASAPSISTSVTVQEAGVVIVACSVGVSTTALHFGSRGGAQNLGVNSTRSDCTWTAGPILGNNGTGWIHLNKTQGPGAGTIQVTVDPASIQGRLATFTVAGITVTVDEDASIPSNGCQCTGIGCGANMQLGAGQVSFGPSGGQTTITLLTVNSCLWTLNSDVPWIQFPNGNRGIGNGSIVVKILPNTGGGSRVAHITSPQATPDGNFHTAHVTISQQ